MRSVSYSGAFAPPLIIDEGGIDLLVNRFALALRDTEAWLASTGE
ncbi:MAG: hypothetical protein ACT4P2_12640 [Pseudomonadota bacterium]